MRDRRAHLRMTLTQGTRFRNRGCFAPTVLRRTTRLESAPRPGRPLKYPHDLRRSHRMAPLLRRLRALRPLPGPPGRRADARAAGAAGEPAPWAERRCTSPGARARAAWRRWWSRSLRVSQIGVGLYTSPHLYSYCERIRVDGGPNLGRSDSRASWSDQLQAGSRGRHASARRARACHLRPADGARLPGFSRQMACRYR